MTVREMIISNGYGWPPGGDAGSRRLLHPDLYWGAARGSRAMMVAFEIALYARRWPPLGRVVAVPLPHARLGWSEFGPAGWRPWADGPSLLGRVPAVATSPSCGGAD